MNEISQEDKDSLLELLNSGVPIFVDVALHKLLDATEVRTIFYPRDSQGVPNVHKAVYFLTVVKDI